MTPSAESVAGGVGVLLHKFNNKNYKKPLHYSINHAIIEPTRKARPLVPAQPGSAFWQGARHTHSQEERNMRTCRPCLKGGSKVKIQMVQEPTIYIIIEEIGDYYIDRLMIIKTDCCTLEEAKKEAREAGYQVIDECSHVVHTAHEVHVIVAVKPV